MPASAALSKRRSAPGGFTLVEVLLSVTILAALVTLTTQMIGSAVRVTSSSHQRLDSDSQARIVFDRLGSDLGQMLKSTSVDCLFAKRDGGSDTAGANDTFYFCSEAAAFSDGTANPPARSTIALLGYRVNSRFQLERLGKALTWDGPAPAASAAGPAGGPAYLTYPAKQATADALTTLDGRWPVSVDAPGTNYNEVNEPDAHVLAEGVFRLEICFLLTDGTFSTRSVTAPAGQKNNLTATVPPSLTDDGGANGGYTVGSRWYDNTARRGYVCRQVTAGAAVWESAGVRDISALVVSLGLLDSTSRKIAPLKPDPTNPLQQIADLTRLQALFADAGEADLASSSPASADHPKLPAGSWVAEMAASDFATSAAVPHAVAAQVRVYQRILPLTPR